MRKFGSLFGNPCILQKWSLFLDSGILSRTPRAMPLPVGVSARWKPCAGRLQVCRQRHVEHAQYRPRDITVLPSCGWRRAAREGMTCPTLTCPKWPEVVLSRSQKQGDKSSPLLFGLIFNALFLALRATGVPHGLGPPVSCPRVRGAYCQILWGHVPAPRSGRSAHGPG